MLLSFKTVLRILDTDLCQMCVLQIFSQSVACLFTLSTVPFAEQTFLILMKSNLPNFSFMDHAFDVVSKNSWPNSRSPRVSPILLSRSFVV